MLLITAGVTFSDFQISILLSVIITALLAIVIFVVVQVIICKCHPKFRPGGFRPGGTETGASTGEEGQEYEVMGGDDGGVAVRGGNDPVYMEVGGEEKGHTFELKENNAYGTLS